MNYFPKYQYSVFISNGQDEQIVIRADNFKEFKTLKRNVDVILKKRGVGCQDKSHCSANEEPAICPIHNVVMKPRKGKYGLFYSHSKRLSDGSWAYCSGKGWGK